MLASNVVPSAANRFHWWVKLLGSPSGSAMLLVVAVRVSPTSAVPEMAGAPVAGSFTAVTRMVMVWASVLSWVPSLTLNLKLA